ncbi:MAG: replication-relaxation family protein [Lachnospiraceae bacterium]|nr:replication-relaxation family protein [Lachnospiraceae bacterium]
MSHRYKTYVERIKEIDEKQSQVGKIIEEQNVNFFQWAIKKSFASEEELLKQINIYGSMKSYNTIKTIEDSLLVLVGFCKFISENSIKYLVDNNKAIEKYVNALQRLSTKGYLYRTDEKDINKSLYGLTEKGKKKLVDILGSDKTLPFSEFNYNTDGIAYHDAVVGQVYMRLLLMRKPFFFSRNYYQRGMLKSDDVYMDAVVSIKHGTEEESNYWIEGDTGTEGVNVIIEKIGKYYLKRLTQNEKKNFVLFVYKENDYNYCQDVYPGLYADVKRMDRINQMISYYDVTYLDEIQELIEDYLELPDEDEYWIGMIPFNSKSFAEALGEKTLTYAKYEMMKYLLYIKTLYFIGDKLMVDIRKMLGDKYICNDTALMLGDYYKKYNNFCICSEPLLAQ